jgi:DNA-binding beta-propeller fold protein YncE
VLLNGANLALPMKALSHLRARRGWTEAIALLVLLAAALVVRVVSITTVPPNVTADEAENLIVAYRIREGVGPGFFGLDWKPAPAFSIYLMTATLRVLGWSIAGMRMTSVLISILVLVPFYFLARQKLGKLPSLLTSALLGFSLWYLHFSRSGWENVHVVLYGVMAAWMMELALRRQSLWWWAGAGFWAALGLYGYIAGRAVLISLLVFLPVAFWLGQQHKWRILLGYGLLLLVCSALFAPQLPSVVSQWEYFNRRVYDVSVFAVEYPYLGKNSLFELLIYQVSVNLRGFFLADGAVMNAPRYAPVGQSLLDGFTATLLIVGLFVGVRRWRQTMLWWIFLLVPLLTTQVFSTHTPDPARAIGMLPFLYLFVGLAMDFLLFRKSGWAGVFLLCLLVTLPTTIVHNVSQYFDWMTSPETAKHRHPAVAVEDFASWQSAILNRIRSDRAVFNVAEWERMQQEVSKPLGRVVTPVNPQDVDRLTPRQEATWGEWGSGDGQFKEPRGVAVDSGGFVYVLDTKNWRIQKFDADGNFLAKWGCYGTGEHELEESFDIVVDAQDILYVLDSAIARIKKFTTDGKFAGLVPGNHGFYRPRGVGIDPKGAILVADTGHDRVVKLAPTGEVLAIFGTQGPGPGQFHQPTDVAVDEEGNIYVADTLNRRIQKLDSGGAYLGEWTITPANTFDGPHLAVRDGIVYATDPEPSRVVVFTLEGVFITEWGSPGNDESELMIPLGIALDADSSVYVTEVGNHRVHKFELSD